MLKNFISWILLFFFLFLNSLLLKHVWIEFKARAERVTKRMTAIRSKFRSTLDTESVKK